MNRLKFLTEIAVLVAIGAITTATAVRADDRYAFYDANGNVVQTITGPLTDEQLAIFMRDYAILFGAVSYEAVDETVQIGDTPSAAPSPTDSPVPTDEPTPTPSEQPSIAPCN